MFRLRILPFRRIIINEIDGDGVICLTLPNRSLDLELKPRSLSLHLHHRGLLFSMPNRSLNILLDERNLNLHLTKRGC